MKDQKTRDNKIVPIKNLVDRAINTFEQKGVLDTGWNKPPKPQSAKCIKCGAVIDWTFTEPIYWENRVFAGTGIWEKPELCNKCLELKLMAEQQTENERLYQSRIQRSGLYPKHLKKRFDNRLGNEDGAVKLCNRFCQKQDFNLFLWGGSGLKKTHLLSAVANELLKSKDIRFWRTPDFLNNIRKITTEFGSADADDFLKAEVENGAPLLIDDIGAEKVTDFALEKFYNFFDFCDLYERKGIIVASNLDLKSLSERLSDRITSRMAGLFKTREVKGEDWRVKR